MLRVLLILFLVGFGQPILAAKTVKEKTPFLWNVRLSPVGLVIGLLGAELDYRFDEKIVFGPMASVWSLSKNHVKYAAQTIGVQGSYYWDRALATGFYAGGVLSWASFSAAGVCPSGSGCSGQASGFTLGAKGGYQWYWGPWNVTTGLVLAYSSISKVRVKDSAGATEVEASSPGTNSGIDLSVGYLFSI
jgi:hypothetical protein